MSEVAHWEEQNGLSVLRMSALEALGGVSAFFTGRAGGISPAWNRGLNWSYSVGDSPEYVQENRWRSLAMLGVAADRCVMAGLVHGDRVVAVSGEEPQSPDQVRLVQNCDALITDRCGLALAVTAADCVPIFLYDPVRRVVGVAHAGWRGTVAGIAGKTVAAMAQQYGCSPADIRTEIGPSIGPCCYEVDDVVVSPLRQRYGAAAESLLEPAAEPGKYRLDLWGANRLDLLQAGVKEVSVAGTCTSCEVDRLFSHRAERGKAGRGAALIALEP